MELSEFGLAAVLLGGGKNRGAFFPIDDATDLQLGLRFVPGEVTMARRRGERVVFIHECSHRCCWYWQFPDGSKSYYWERWDYEQIAAENNAALSTSEYGSRVGDPGACQYCGNVHTVGGRIEETA